MNYDEIMNDLERISSESGKALEILFEEIGFELTEALFKPVYEYVLPDHNTVVVETFLRSIEALAGKIVLYRLSEHEENGKPQRFEAWIRKR